MEQNNYYRQPAIKISINEVLCSPLIEEEAEQNHLLDCLGRNIFRLNIMGVIFNKEQIGSITNLHVDDGTNKIIFRSFEENDYLNGLKIGDNVLIIGKLRNYNEERYISPEIVKKVNPLWLKVRGLELKKLIENKQRIKDENFEEKKEEFIKKKEKKLIEEKNELLPFQKISKIIQEMDKGEGVLIEEIIEKSPLNDTERLLKKMLEKGDIFQIAPGKVKIL